VAERVRGSGMHMGLWFEPERAHRTSELALRHPDWLLTAPGRDFALVNFALPAVREYVRLLLADYVRRLDLRRLKWDFNMDPLPHWQAAGDGGLAHVGHINGVWETFDWLRAAFPQLVIENCASGGNRLDWVMFSRAHVNFANDQYTHPDCLRRILGRMAAFMPSERLNMFVGPLQHREYGNAEWQVLLGSAFGVGEPVDNWTDVFRDHLRRHLELHQSQANARAGDFYRLTPDTSMLAAWEAWQMHDPATRRGLIAAWRSGAPEPSIVLHPRGIDAARTYILEDRYDGGARAIPGEVLARGIEVAAAKAGSTLHVYRPYVETRTEC
jgi:alpha-galactosidase